MKWSNSLILEFLKHYELEPAIWNPRHGLHKDRQEISDAWRRIEANLSVECSIEELKRKKDSLMATYRSLRSKTKQKEREWGGEDAYRPNWFAYEAMFNFLGDVYQPKNFNSQEIDGIHMEDLDDMEDELLLESDDAPELHLKPGSSFKQPQERSGRKRKDPNVNTCMCDNLFKDECSLYSQLLAKKLRVFDDRTRMVLMHEIDNFVFRAKVRKGSKSGDLIGGLDSDALEEYTQRGEGNGGEVESGAEAGGSGVLVKREAR